MLNLRGMTLAGRLADRSAGRTEAERHIQPAATMSEQVPEDTTRHSMIFGPANTVTHLLATRLDLGAPRQAVRAAGELSTALEDLPPTRVAPSRINLARAYLDLGDREAALDSLILAGEAAPQMTRVHPMAQEVYRVLISLHQLQQPPAAEALTRLSGLR
jgi:hypothetical protein